MEGNQMKMRESLEFADRELRMATEDDRYGDDLVYLVGCMRSVADVCRAALSDPPRNCDVGTAKEQDERFRDFCPRYTAGGVSDCEGCKLHGTPCAECAIPWEQMPYEVERKGEGDD